MIYRSDLKKICSVDLIFSPLEQNDTMVQHPDALTRKNVIADNALAF